MSIWELIWHLEEPVSLEVFTGHYIFVAECWSSDHDLEYEETHVKIYADPEYNHGDQEPWYSLKEFTAQSGDCWGKELIL
jgi:hypothetical protein